MKITKKALLQLYIIDQKSVREIGEIVGKSPKQVSRYLKKFRIKARPFSTKGLKPWLGKTHSEETKKKIGKAHTGKKLSPEHRAKVVKTLSSYGDQGGSKNPQWKGGKIRKGENYIAIKIPNHPNSNKNGYCLEHRLIMSRHLGRPLKKGEFVHHINGIRQDNRIENLQLMQTQRHYGELECPWCHKKFLVN